ncbi:AIPR family protein [Streptomyces sp. NPDC001339]|uniref:AIPR family protein n=1 Tax=Streptomyces sp. NPDC001339 TaxID=3364563 RepID=UPI00369BE955
MRDLQVRHLKTTLTDQFKGLIDLTDRAAQVAADKEGTFLTRALAALAVHEVTGWERKQAAECVIDGFDDEGIDAIAVDAEAPHVWIIQSKWSGAGNATFDQDAWFVLASGLKYLVKGEYQRFNSRLQAMAADLDEALNNPKVQVTVVFALAGGQGLSPNIQQRCADLKAEYNEDQEFLRFETLLLADFTRTIRAGIDEPNVELSARMSDFRPHEGPFIAYHGTVAADQVATWYADHRHRLFKRNIRHPLGLTKINGEMVNSVVHNPELFWYLHNGITVLCDQLEIGPRGDLKLQGASVVNGAQTVASLHEAHERSPEALAKARISVRVIPLKDTPHGFAERVTIATNTQNSVVQQDFRALDKIQKRLRYDFDVTLGKTYVIKRGEEPPERADGCHMNEAAVALACAHKDARMSFRANTEKGRRLWDNDTYPQIFRTPDARRVWRAVQLVREVRRALVETQGEREGRAALLAEQGPVLIAHLVFQSQRDWHSLDDAEWEQLLKRGQEITDATLRWAMYAVDDAIGANSQISAIFRSDVRYQTATQAALSAMLGGHSAPPLALEYRNAVRESRARQAKAVTVILEAEAIEEGTGLEFRPVTGPERAALSDWVAEEPRRGRATWVRHPSRPLLWEWDGQQYSPSALVQEMFALAHKKGPKAVQGTRRWFVPEEGSLVEIADRLRVEADS